MQGFGFLKEWTEARGTVEDDPKSTAPNFIPKSSFRASGLGDRGLTLTPKKEVRLGCRH